MNWLLERKLKNLGKNADPEPRFVRALERRLRVEVGHPLWWIQGWKIALGSITAVSLIGSGTGVYAYTSNDVLLDHPLYGLRTTIEKVETKLARTPEQRSQIRVKHLARRVKEQSLLQAQHKEVPKTLIQDIEKKIDSQIDEDGRLPEKTQDEMDEQVGALKSQHEDLLKEIPDQNEAAKPAMEQLNKKIETLDAKRKLKLGRRGSRKSENKQEYNKEDVRSEKPEGTTKGTDLFHDTNDRG